MTSKERILTTINHQEPDRVPRDSWLAPEVAKSLVRTLNLDLANDNFALARTLGNDILYTRLGIADGFKSIYKKERKIGDDLYQDAWGIKWRKKDHEYGSYCEIAEPPLADIRNYDDYNWPNPLEVEKDGLNVYKELIESYGKQYAIVGSVPCTIFEASCFLRGFEDLLADLYLNKDFVIQLFDKTMNYHLQISKRLVEMGVDIIWWGDDIGTEKGPCIAPKMYRQLLKPRYAYMIQEVKKINKNVKIAFHTDGDIGWALDDIVEIGMDILNPLQPDVNNVEMIKRKYGKTLAFWGNVDTRKVMSHGSCTDVVEEVKNVISILAPGGGFILSSNHTIQATERAVDNTIAYYWAADKFGNYPIKV